MVEPNDRSSLMICLDGAMGEGTRKNRIGTIPTGRKNWDSLFKNVSGWVNALAIDLDHVMQVGTCG